jgi:hypothetical protein
MRFTRKHGRQAWPMLNTHSMVNSRGASTTISNNRYQLP